MRNFFLIFFLFFLCFLNGCVPAHNVTLRVIHAGSLSLPVKQITEAYREQYPEVKILTESWGSKAGARQITELKKECDVFISADNTIIENFLMPDYASWSIPFAGNEMVLAYTPGSLFADCISRENWYQILAHKEVLTARSSPDADPCGDRAVLMLLLADIYYGNDLISKQLLAKDSAFIRPKEADLIALLEKNTVDYLYIYKSIAIQHHFKYLDLPDSINLAVPELSAYYAQVTYNTLGKTPGSTYEERGAPIVYGITMPHTSVQRDEAAQYIHFFLDSAHGAQILERNGQNMLLPAHVSAKDSVPVILHDYLY